MTTIVFPVSRIRSTFWRRTAIVALAPVALTLLLIGIVINLALAPFKAALEFAECVVDSAESAASMWRTKA